MELLSMLKTGGIEGEGGGRRVVRISLLCRLIQHPLVKTIEYAKIQAYLNIIP